MRCEEATDLQDLFRRREHGSRERHDVGAQRLELIDDARKEVGKVGNLLYLGACLEGGHVFLDDARRHRRTRVVSWRVIARIVAQRRHRSRVCIPSSSLGGARTSSRTAAAPPAGRGRSTSQTRSCGFARSRAPTTTTTCERRPSAPSLAECRAPSWRSCCCDAKRCRRCREPIERAIEATSRCAALD